MANYKRSLIAKSSIRRVIGLSELFSFAGTWLTRKGKRFTGLATIITSGAVVADILGNNFFGYQLPVNKLEMATAPVIAAAATFGLGGAMNYTAKLLSGADRSAAEANSVCEVREIKQTPQATRKQAEDLWNRVWQYESILINGKDASQKEIDYLSECRAELIAALAGLPNDCLSRHGVDMLNRRRGIEKLVRHIEVANPFSSGIESSKEGFVESVIFALNEAMPHMEQKYRIGFDLSQIESYRNWEIFESRLSKEYSSNRFLRSAQKKANLPPLSALEIKVKSFGDDILKNLTRNKLYMMAGKGMNVLNSKLNTNAFDAQPFIWMTDALQQQIRDACGDDILNRILFDRHNIRKQIFGSSTEIKSHIYDCFETDLLRASILRLGFDVEYSAGILEQKPENDIALVRNLVGRKIFNGKLLARYRQTAEKSLQDSAGLVAGLDEITARAVKIAHYTNIRPAKNKTLVEEVVPKAARFSEELVQTRIYDYLARQQIKAHYNLIKKLDQKPSEDDSLSLTRIKSISQKSNLADSRQLT